MAADQSRGRGSAIMNMQIKIEGLKELQQAFQNAKAEVRAQVMAETERAAVRVHAAAVKRIQRGPASGTVYVIENQGEYHTVKTADGGFVGAFPGSSPNREHQASAPGEPAMSDTGDLATSVEWASSGMDAFVFSKKKHALYTEVGTVNMAARPWLLPSLEEEGPKYLAALKGILK